MSQWVLTLREHEVYPIPPYSPISKEGGCLQKEAHEEDLQMRKQQGQSERSRESPRPRERDADAGLCN